MGATRWVWTLHLDCGCKVEDTGREQYEAVSLLDEFECPKHGTVTVVRMGGHN